MMGQKKQQTYSSITSPKSTPSAFWHCWLGVRKGIRPVKNYVMRYWRGYLCGAKVELFPLALNFSCICLTLL